MLATEGPLLLLAGAGQLAAGPVLVLLQTPRGHPWGDALLYLRVMYLGVPVTDGL